MIQHSRQQCVVCAKRATRSVPDRPRDNGIIVTLWLCDSCPDPQQIDQAARRIAWSWSPTEMATRVFDCTSGSVDYHQAVELTRVTVGTLDGRVARPAEGD